MENKIKMYQFKSTFLFCVILLFHACGFHLAGEGSFSEEVSNTHVQASSSSKELIRLLEKNLVTNKINVVKSEEATALLNILSEETERVVLTLDSDGKAREYELLLNITFEVKTPNNSTLLKPQTISLNRDFVFDKSDLLGANEEEQDLYNEMRNDAAKLIVYRLQTI